MKFIVMAGGTGSKLWPISRKKAPKQFIPLIGEKTLFQHNVEALLERFSPADIYVSTSEDIAHFVKEQVPQFRQENILVEPSLKRDSGPATGFAILHLLEQFPDEVVNFYVQSPIVRTPVDLYLDMIESMEEMVKEYDKLITGTQIPRYTEIGSDLMILGENIKNSHKFNISEVEGLIDVVKDRMTKENVQEVMDTKKVGTHCNHYTWTPKRLMEAIEKYRPDWFRILKEIQPLLKNKAQNSERIYKLYRDFEPGRIELVTKQLMQSGQVQAVEVPYKWTHITTWDDVYRFYKEEKIETHDAAEVIEVDSENNNLIISKSNKLVATVDVKDSIIIETDDSILICPKVKANQVKRVHDILEQRGLDKYL